MNGIEFFGKSTDKFIQLRHIVRNPFGIDRRPDTDRIPFCHGILEYLGIGCLCLRTQCKFIRKFSIRIYGYLKTVIRICPASDDNLPVMCRNVQKLYIITVCSFQDKLEIASSRIVAQSAALYGSLQNGRIIAVPHLIESLQLSSQPPTVFIEAGAITPCHLIASLNIINITIGILLLNLQQVGTVRIHQRPAIDIDTILGISHSARRFRLYNLYFTELG